MNRRTCRGTPHRCSVVSMSGAYPTISAPSHHRPMRKERSPANDCHQMRCHAVVECGLGSDVVESRLSIRARHVSQLWTSLITCECSRVAAPNRKPPGSWTVLSARSVLTSASLRRAAVKTRASNKVRMTNGGMFSACSPGGELRREECGPVRSRKLCRARRGQNHPFCR